MCHSRNPIDDFYRPLKLIVDRVYLFIVKGVSPVPVIFKEWSDEEKRLVIVSLYGIESVVHASCIYMTKRREAEKEEKENEK